MKPFVTLFASLATAVAAAATPVAAQSPEDLFESRVRPILAGQCAECHSEARTRGRLKVTTRADLLTGGKSGPAIVPGDPNASLLIKAVRHEIAKMEMPRDAPRLSPRDIDGLVEWVRMGAPWPESAPPITVAASMAGGGEGMTPGARLFVSKVQPVLEQKCFACHTSDERGGLRLDSRERILKGGGRGPAVIPGNPEQSLLIAALRHEREDLRMPRNAAKLSDAEIQGFVEWIQAGAEWAKAEAPIAVQRRATTKAEREFWSFRPHPVIKVPTPAKSGWAKTDIDRFVLAKLEQHGLTPARAADKRTLIRRATFGLIGLPPTTKEVNDFLADTSATAFLKVVDRLLASEHYGEKWARHWLDVTRYGEDDTRGLAPDGSGRERYPMAHIYRDWVVDAFNADMRYDTLVMAHLAADQMPGRKDLLPGLGFLGQGPWYYDLADPPVARADERHDRVDVTTRGFLGLTVGCARCHDHKYDPIGTHDYYALAGVFNNANYHEYPIADSARAEKYKKDKEFIKKMNEGIGEYMRTESDQLARVLTLQVSKYMMAAWRVTGREQLPKERAALEARLDLETLERWIDFLDDPPKHYPFLTDWQKMIAAPVGTTDEAKTAAKKKAQELADAFQRLLIDVTIEQKKLEEKNKKIIAKGTPLEEVKSIPMPNGFESFFDQHQLELATMDRSRFNLYLDVFVFDLDNELDTFFPRPALLRFNGWGLERQLSRVAADHLNAMREEVKRLQKELPDIPFVMGVQDKPKESLDDIALHIRGSPLNLGERVPRGFPHVLQSDADSLRVYREGSGRLQLAQDIATHPLAARVIVNRVWGWHMGAGIVRTPSNFGFAGAKPTDPELLEYLAERFVANGRSIKQLHRDIMLSAVYQMASEHDAKSAAIDPENQYLWRFNRQRLTAEGIRDALLVTSGRLVDSIGGSSLELDDEKNNRRTLYASVSRFQPHIFLQTFDFPSPSLTAERRFATNVPLQSLYFMNSPFVLQQAQALVRRLADSTAAPAVAKGTGDSAATVPRRTALKPAPPPAPVSGAGPAGPPPPKHFDDRAMIRAAYPLLYGREATGEEIELGLAFLSEQRTSLLASESTKAAAEAKKDEELLARKVSMKAWTQYARALFSAAEFRFID
jgi:mono/diheme cytochrome c family protein